MTADAIARLEAKTQGEWQALQHGDAELATYAALHRAGQKRARVVAHVEDARACASNEFGRATFRGLWSSSEGTKQFVSPRRLLDCQQTWQERRLSKNKVGDACTVKAFVPDCWSATPRFSGTLQGCEASVNNVCRSHAMPADLASRLSAMCGRLIVRVDSLLVTDRINVSSLFLFA
jgi:hypothetical protein